MFRSSSDSSYMVQARVEVAKLKVKAPSVSMHRLAHAPTLDTLLVPTFVPPVYLCGVIIDVSLEEAS